MLLILFEICGRLSEVLILNFGIFIDTVTIFGKPYSGWLFWGLLMHRGGSKRPSYNAILAISWKMAF